MGVLQIENSSPAYALWFCNLLKYLEIMLSALKNCRLLSKISELFQKSHDLKASAKQTNS
jgi:hypothetical protein